MTSGVYAYAGGSPRRRFAGRVGHFAPAYLIMAVIMSVVLGLHPIGDGTSFISLAIPMVLMASVFVIWALMRVHDHQLCEVCMASMPLNPSESAIRYYRRFQVVHVGARRGVVLSYIAALIATNLLFNVYPNLLMKAVWALTQLSLIYLVLSYNTHRKLQPWCPSCGSGGSEIDSSVPDTDRPSYV